MVKEKNIIFKAVVEMVGRPKEHISDMLKNIVKDLQSNPDYEVIREHHEEPQEHETMFSSFVEIEVKVADVASIAWFCFDFLPASVEIIEPENVNFKAYALSSFLNELTTRMHIVDKEMKRFQIEANIINKNSKQIVKNSIMICLAKQELAMNDLEKFTGVPEKLLSELCDELIKDEFIEKNGDLYKAK